MAWYSKYLSIYGKNFNEVSNDIISETRERLAALQSEKPLASIVVIAYNEEQHLQACLWALSEIKCKYPVEIIGVDNDSKDRTAEIFEASGIPYYTEYQQIYQIFLAAACLEITFDQQKAKQWKCNSAYDVKQITHNR